MMNLLKKLFHRHKWRGFKTGRFPLVARYCEKCGTVEFGNSVYYDGSVYQERFKGQEAVGFIESNISFVNSHIEGLRLLREVFGVDKAIISNNVLEDYETIEEYERIIKLIKEKS